MAGGYKIKCPKCNYSFMVLFGMPARNPYNEKYWMKPENYNTELNHVRMMMNHFGRVSVETEVKPYLCTYCRQHFNYGSAILKSNRGVYVERGGICPSCNSISFLSIEEDFFTAPYEHGEGELKLHCPKCDNNLFSNGFVWVN